MKTKTTVLTIIMLIGGFALGYAFGTMPKNIKPDMHHHMNDESMMHDTSMMDGDDMGVMMMDMTSRMKGKKGDELDRVFLEDMIVHHQGAVDMAKILQAGTQRLELQKMAQDIITVQTKEIEMMRGWLTNWFK